MATTDYSLYVRCTKTLFWILDCVERLLKKVRFSLASRISGLAMLQGIVEAIYQRGRLATLRQINLNLGKLQHRVSAVERGEISDSSQCIWAHLHYF